MASPIGWLVDGFDSASAAPPWQVLLGGSATATQSGSQAIFTLPSSTAGSHFAQYATVATYDLTGDSMSMTIGTMVSTSVAASAYLVVLYDASNYLQWIQTSGTLKAQKVIAGVPTDIYSVAWNAATYKWLRIRENAGVTVFESSTNGISWTARGGTFTNVFAMTSLSVRVGASCGNVASPGSLRLDDVNINAGLASSWRWTQVEWPLLYRFRPITLSAVGGQGYIAVASTIDSSGNLVSPTYYSGPLGSASGGYNALALASSQAVAQNNAVNLPLNDRWDLPAIVEGRFIRLYHRSLDASAHTLREYYPRRIVQADDIEAESIRAINIAAGAITADKIFVLNLAAISAYIGQLSIDPTGWIYQGSGTGAAPTTGLKIFNSGGIGKLSTYNAGVEQVTFDTDGKLKAGAGAVKLDATGIDIIDGASFLPLNAYTFSSGGAVTGGLYGAIDALFTYVQLWVKPQTTITSQLFLYSDGGTGQDGQIAIRATGGAGFTAAEILMDAGPVASTFSISATQITLDLLNVGTSNTAGFGEISSSGTIHAPRPTGNAVFALDATTEGTALTIANTANAQVFSNARVFSGLLIISETAVSGAVGLFLIDGAGVCILVSQTGTNYSNTLGTASKSNVYLAAGVVRIENRLGSTATYNIMALRTRSS